jgi:hypothetical protein
MLIRARSSVVMGLSFYCQNFRQDPRDNCDNLRKLVSILIKWIGCSGQEMYSRIRPVSAAESERMMRELSGYWAAKSEMSNYNFLTIFRHLADTSIKPRLYTLP